MLTPRTVCLAAVALTATTVGQAAAQLTINIGRPPRLPPRYNIGTVGGYRPFPPVYRPPAIGVVAPPISPYWPVPPVVTLRPTIYPGAYVNLFRPGYQTILAGNVAYYYYPALPPGATFVQVGGAQYYQAGGIWYQPYPFGGQNVFLIVPPPI